MAAQRVGLVSLEWISIPWDVWTDKFDFNTLRVDGENFESGKKKTRIQKYSYTCRRGPSQRDIGSAGSSSAKRVLQDLVLALTVS